MVLALLVWNGFLYLEYLRQPPLARPFSHGSFALVGDDDDWTFKPQFPENAAVSFGSSGASATRYGRSDICAMAWPKAPGEISRKIGRPQSRRPKHSCSSRSADVRHPFLGLRLGCGSGLCRELEHCCFLTFKYVSQQHGLPVWKFQRIMMCSRVVLVDLPEDGHCMIDPSHLPGEQPPEAAPYRLGKSELRSWQNAIEKGTHSPRRVRPYSIPPAVCQPDVWASFANH